VADDVPHDVRRDAEVQEQGHAGVPNVVEPHRFQAGFLAHTAPAAAALNKAEAQKTAVPASQKATAAAWQSWLAQQHTTGNGARPDFANPEQMNRYTWYQTHGWKMPYPGDAKIYAPSQVPGAYLPGSDN
jgi:hypothetical protein